MVSIIVPNYNHVLFLKQRLESIFNQTCQDFELIILDDNSTDGSQEFLLCYKDHPKVAHLIFNAENSGSPFKQWKKGVALAKGNWVWIAESDDACKNDLLEKLLFVKNDAESCGLRFTVSQKIDEQGNNIDTPFTSLLSQGVYKGIDFLQTDLLELNHIPNASAVLVKKELIMEALQEDVMQFRTVGDWLTWCKIALKTDVYFSTDTLNLHRFHTRTARYEAMMDKGYFHEFAAFRKALAAVLETIKENDTRKKLLKKNTSCYYKETGNVGTEMIQNKHYLQSIYPILKASLFPVPNVYFIKSALYWLFKKSS